MRAHAAAAEFLIGPRAGLLALVVLVGVVLLATDKHGSVAWWPFKLGWALARWVGFRPIHLPALAATAVLVFHAAPIAGWRLPLALAAVGWWAWLHRPAGSAWSPRWPRRAERRYANALRDATRNLHRTTAAKTQPTPTRPARPARRPSTARPTPTNRPAPATAPARPVAQPEPATAKPRRTGPAAPKPPGSAPSWTPPPPPPRLEPVWPRWLGGGRWRKPKGG